jgi:hypothetical protein
MNPMPTTDEFERTMHDSLPHSTLDGRTPAIGSRRAPAPDIPDRHARKCRVCAHPDRDSIDQDFLQWGSPRNISMRYELPIDSIYRHAHSTGLFRRRAGKIRSALEFVIEQAERCTPSADAIIRAVRAYTHINDDGKWIEPRKEVVYTTRHESAAGPMDVGEDVPEPDAPYASGPLPDDGAEPHASPEFLIANAAIRNST